MSAIAILAHGQVMAQLAVVAPVSDMLATLNQGESIAKWAEQLAEMKRQYDQMKQQYEAVTGSYGRGQLGLNDSINAASVVPGSWQEVVAQQAQGAYGTKQGQYEQVLKTMPRELFQDPKGQGAATYQLSSDSVRAAMSSGDALYGQVQTHLNNLTRLGQQIDSTANLKDAQDLQNRIAVENGMLQTAMAKLTAMNVNLQANMLNEQNQATSSVESYHRRSSN
ncbi:type IV secretion system protein [Variovorax sp. J22P168]|uniref:type IV secretion system protein n=1 Tax=Variovorax jilinensis TaxID=3053513 RepID=UPI0025788376|nr:type IV secretion system protein [Variovorax sp. J22P168]MDM0015049.1 type IV secretion system protein [Variovorax sp. J22P168]